MVDVVDHNSVIIDLEHDAIRELGHRRVSEAVLTDLVPGRYRCKMFQRGKYCLIEPSAQALLFKFVVQ